jgi:hypothetical protein
MAATGRRNQLLDVLSLYIHAGDRTVNSIVAQHSDFGAKPQPLAHAWERVLLTGELTMVTSNYFLQFPVKIAWCMVVLLLVTALGIGLALARNPVRVTTHRPPVQVHLALALEADGFGWD